MKKKIKSEYNANKIIKFFWFGISIYWINLWLTFFFINILLLNSSLSYFLTMVCIVIYSFIVSFKLVFNVNFSYYLLLKYLFALIIFSTINYILVIILKKHIWEEYLYLLIIIVNTILSIIKFFVYNKFVFNKNKKW